MGAAQSETLDSLTGATFMHADYCYDRRTSPLLPLSEGSFQFLHTSNDRIHDIAARGLRPYPLGELKVPSGRLIVGDPFAGLTRHHNRCAQIPAGTYAVWQTLADVSDNQTGQPLRVAYLSLVLNNSLLARRWQWQQERLLAELSPALPVHALRHYPLTVQASDLDFAENEQDAAGFRIQSGTVALADAAAFSCFMPDDNIAAGEGWYDQLFEHGVANSWFDRMDYTDHYRRGAANFPLPNASPDNTVVLSQSGWGDGTYFLLAEYAFNYQDEEEGDENWQHDPPLVALHLDFRVVPFDPSRPSLPLLDDAPDDDRA